MTGLATPTQLRDCDCLNDCGDDEGIRRLEARKCEAAIAGEAARRAEAWQAFETWFRTPTWPTDVAPCQWMDETSARCGWFAARRRHAA